MTTIPPQLTPHQRKKQCEHNHFSTKSIPSEILSIIESYLPPSSCANLSATCHYFRSRWTTIRWCHTFKFHYGPKEEKLQDSNIMYYRDNDINTMSSTQFNVSALIPSLQKAYSNLCITLELAFLGFYDRRFTDFTNENVALPDIMQLFYFFVGFKPIEVLLFRKKSFSDLRNPFNMFALWRCNSMTINATKSISAWKLACLLKEKGMDCLRCSICDQIDLLEDLWRVKNNVGNGMMGSNAEEEFGDNAWCSPCSCPDSVHRRCLERKLGLVLHFPGVKMEDGRMWISYDDPSPELQPSDIAAVDRTNKFLSRNAKCTSCGDFYMRGVRLPRSTNEVLFASLADPLSLFRAFSTMIHFCLCLVFIGATEGMCTDEEYCGNHHVLVITRSAYHFVFKWPRGNKGLFLAWWQLHQCCMLHIFFSPRFATIVDRLSFGPISYFYCRLYIYFLITSIILGTTLLPSVSRAILKNIILPNMSKKLVKQLSPVLQFITYFNLSQYVIVSSIVICIFWRTNYRIFTVANARGWGQRRRSNWSHPIYYGHWQSLR